MLFLSYLILAFVGTSHGARFDSSEVDFNLNQNQTAINPLDYWGEWADNHTFHPSPSNWRFPFYTLFLDR